MPDEFDQEVEEIPESDELDDEAEAKDWEWMKQWMEEWY